MTDSRRLEASDRSVRVARHFVAGLIADAPIDVQESVSLMVSELATNALVHAASGFEVSVDRSDVTVLVAVSDRGDAGMPRMQAPASSEPHGRGLRVVDALSDEWGVTTTWDHGKTVWFRISLQLPTSNLATHGDSEAARLDRAEQGSYSRATADSIIGTAEARSDAPDAVRRGTDPRFKVRMSGSLSRRRRSQSSRQVYLIKRIDALM